MSILSDLPFVPGFLYEVLVTTFNENLKPNAAPMGVSFTTEGKVIVRPFTSSDTYKNIKKQGAFVINISHEPELFVKSTLFQNELTEEFFESAKTVRAPYLRACAGSYLEVKVPSGKTAQTKEHPLRRTFLGEVISNECSVLLPLIPYTRAFSSLIEILIHASRLEPLSEKYGISSDVVRQLLFLIDHHSKILQKVTPANSKYRKLLQKITTRIITFNDENSTAKG